MLVFDKFFTWSAACGIAISSTMLLQLIVIDNYFIIYSVPKILFSKRASNSQSMSMSDMRTLTTVQLHH